MRYRIVLLAAGLLVSITHSQGVPCRVPFASGGQTWNADCYSSHDITRTHAGLNRLVIVVHGAGLNGDSYYSGMVSAARRANNTTSLIFAPQFHESAQSDASTLYWPGGWRGGANSRNGPGISNFTVLDTVIERITTLNPQIKIVTITGHSAGGQVLGRYSAGTPITEGIKARKGVHIRYIISNPSSYLYFNNERWVNGTRYQFRIPTDACSSYDNYLYGLRSGLNPYMARAGVETLRSQFRGRDVAVLLGTADTNAAASDLDRSCGAMQQGRHRFERGNVFHAHIGHYFGPQIYQTHRIGWAPGIAHAGSSMWSSRCGLFFLFDYGTCTDPAPVSVAARQAPPSLLAFREGSAIRVQVPAAGQYRLELYSPDGSLAADRRLPLEAGGSHRVSLGTLGLSPTALYAIRLHGP